MTIKSSKEKFRVIILCLYFVFFLFLSQSAWADKILLKNGNTLEGRIEKENDEAVWFELKLRTGRGQTKILRSEIKSIESNVGSLETKSQGWEQFDSDSHRELKGVDNQAKTNEMMKKIPFFVLGGIFITLIIWLFLKIRVKRKEIRELSVSAIPSSTAAVNPQEIKTAVFKRPLGVKLIWLLLGFWAVFSFLFGLMCNSLAMNKVILNFKEGFRLSLCMSFNIVLPIFLFILAFGLFYLRNWARIILIIFLIFGIGEMSLSWVLKKNLTATLSQAFLQGTKQGFDVKELIENPKLISLPSFKKPLNESAGHKKGKGFDQTKHLVFALFYLLLILYLYREKTKKAFQEARQYKLSGLIKKKRLLTALCFIFILGFLGDKLYQYAFIRFSHDAHFFMRPAKSEGIIKKDTSRLKDFQEYSDLGYRFYLPKDMKRMEDPLSLVSTFFDKEKGRLFSISKLSQGEYELFTAMNYARWNPILLLFKLIMPHSGKTISIQKIIFEKQEGIMSVSFNAQRDYKTFVFYLKDKQDNAIECLFAGKSSDSFTEEKNILNMAAFIEEK
ncbi:MAG: hypothetical protein V2A64_04205 [Candidatus Omnitrophota bacterium]